MKQLIMVSILNSYMFSWIRSITENEKDPEIQKRQHTEAHVKQGNHVLELEETTKQTSNDESYKTVECVKKGSNNESSQVCTFTVEILYLHPMQTCMAIANYFCTCTAHYMLFSLCFNNSG